MTSVSMLKNYATTAVRVLLRDKTNSIITLVSLSLSLAAAVVIAIYVWDETHYDAHQADIDRLYRVEMTVQLPGRPQSHNLQSPLPLMPMLLELDGVEEAERLYMQWSTLSREGDASLQLSQRVYSASDGFFDLFEVEVVAGNAVASLADPKQAILTETLRDRLFPNQSDVVGKGFIVDGVHTLIVGAVIKSLRHDTHLAFDIVTSENAAHIRNRNQWEQGWTRSSHNYVKLRSAAQAASLEQDLVTWVADKLPAQSIDGTDYTIDDLMTLRLRPVSDIHLQTALDYRISDSAASMRPTGDAKAVGILIVIAVVIVTIGSINYINLSTARALTRTREVAMRKVAGASQRQLVGQFLGESVLYVVAAFIVALALAELALGPVNNFTDKSLTLADLWEPGLLMVSVGLVLSTALVAGLYPAFYLASIRPREIWVSQTSRSGLWVRRGLVVLQFTISIALLICTMVFQAQTRFAQELDLGFTTDNVITIYGTGRAPADAIALHDRLEMAFRRHPGVLSVSGAASQPSWDYLDTGMAVAEIGGRSESIPFGYISVDTDYFETFEIEAVAGRTFSDELAADRLLWNLEADDQQAISVLINQAAVRQLGWANPGVALDQLFDFEFDNLQRRAVRVVGVLPDVHFKTVRSVIPPMLYLADPTQFNALNVRFDPLQMEQALAHVDQAFKEVLPYQAVARDFVSEEIRGQYREDTRRTQIFAVAAGLAILIACLGLYGLAAFSAVHKTKEVVLRKIVGANVGQLITLLLMQFSTSVLIANVLAWPLSWWLVSEWLQQFAYRIELTFAPFAWAALCSLFIAALTVIYHALRLARVSPAVALRYQ